MGSRRIEGQHSIDLRWPWVVEARRASARMKEVGDAERVLRTLGSEVEVWTEKLTGDGSELEFAVRVAPVTGPGTSPFASQNAFDQVLEGAIWSGRGHGKKPSPFRIHALQVTTPDIDGTATHSIVLTSLPGKMYRGWLSIPSYQSYAFVRVSTSGYSGGGPELHKFLHKLLSDAGSNVHITEVIVDEDPLPGLFMKYGPTFWFRWPEPIYPPRSEWKPPKDPTRWSDDP